PVGIVDEDDVVLLDHRHQDVLELARPELALVELRLHRLARLEVGESTHEEERVRILDRLERSDDLHPDLGVRRHGFRTPDLEEAGATTRLDLVGAHLDDPRYPWDPTPRRSSPLFHWSPTR